MKSILFTLFLVPYLACNSNADTPTEEASQSMDEIVDETVSIANSVNPGEATFKVKVLETFDSKKDICGVSRSHVVNVEVITVIERGMGITHLPHKKQQVLMNFLLAPKDLPDAGILEVKAKESLCMQASESYFTIISHKILD